VVKWGAIVVAAGRGQRHGGEPKQYLSLLGKPVLRWSVDALSAAGAAEIVVAIDPDHGALAEVAISGTPARLVPGGATRTTSVRTALTHLRDLDAVLIHDAARPGLSSVVVSRLIAALEAGAQAVAPVLPIPDALIDARGEAVDRDGIVRVQTPQAFHLATLRQAYARAAADESFPDDLAVVRAMGVSISFVEGDARLMKITYPGDLDMAAQRLGERFVCVGNGVDAHRFGPGEHVTLCGVRIPHERGLIGHSDADAGWHALVDAILGAIGEGDIGAHFPPSDPRWRGADSETFLRHAAQLVRSAGARLMHVDVTLVCERPRVGPHREAMRMRTAEVLGLAITRVSVKATTTEKMGFLGREEGLAAFATASVERVRAD
jgi:2-C-methyl-D-erythritol 4-phosphate cytidylyltransferase/2-C-methyl-D-erythritol 2,4-cyclodiphosphate synthase